MPQGPPLLQAELAGRLLRPLLIAGKATTVLYLTVSLLQFMMIVVKLAVRELHIQIPSLDMYTLIRKQNTSVLTSAHSYFGADVTYVCTPRQQ